MFNLMGCIKRHCQRAGERLDMIFCR